MRSATSEIASIERALLTGFPSLWQSLRFLHAWIQVHRRTPSEVVAKVVFGLLELIVVELDDSAVGPEQQRWGQDPSPLVLRFVGFHGFEGEGIQGQLQPVLQEDGFLGGRGGRHVEMRGGNGLQRMAVRWRFGMKRRKASFGLQVHHLQRPLAFIVAKRQHEVGSTAEIHGDRTRV